ncbi:Retrovirus-related Pol polyprotein from transposon RE1 [Vitis vinifera]|uniref:Retrovirus-related Pol polyprotein from transposon RE1 n=1 Tax=Vitis vinifera TaxID=29760 RepID=A0A438JMA0_VITVI|nr:Retrovirus-related Pol polyprotein from transposon RE1 [Vitis vinifera]
MKDPEDIATYRKSIERQRVRESSRIDSTQRSLLDLEECYALIQREVVRHASMKAESDNPDTSAMDIQIRQMIGCGIKRGKLYYLDLQSKDSNKLRQALMADGFEGEKKKSEFGYGIDVWDMLPLGEYQKEIQTLDYDYHISEEDESGQFELVNQEAAIPNSVQEALADPRWKAAMNEEMKSLQKNETWELVECPPGKKPVGSRWIYTVKYKVDGSIERFKVRLVAKAANLDWPLQQFDVKNVFLHGELSDEVYMDLPSGCMVSEKQCQKVCKLKKSLYGLKQSLRAWFGRFTKSMRAFGYRQSNSDHTLFLKKQHGPLKYFLRIEVSRSSEGIFLSQRKYTLDILQETGMSGCQPVDTPIEEGLKLCVEPNQVSTDKGKYQRLVGRLMHLAHTRPDLTYALIIVSQHMHNTGEQHINAVMRILRYLKNAPGKGILFTKNVDHQSIEVYTDADWVGAVDDSQFTSGYFTFVGSNLVTWKSKKQNVVARSSVEEEFRGMALGLCEAL